MGSRHPNPRLVKIHRTYTIDEVAVLLRVHRNTVRNWIKSGLATTDGRRPLLVRGPSLIAFLRDRRIKNKQACQPGEIYCVCCRAPRMPAGGIADYQPLTLTSGNLVAICPTCDRLIYRRVNLKKLSLAKGSLEVTIRAGKNT